ncbi:hypothetical protein JL720_6213 [Aureococcus anophagefferens]|nr:hypothetical protein JL720_6213 [Aureococcus anophagefferens]
MSDANNAPSPPASVASTLPGPLSPAGVAAEVDAAFASDAELRLLVRQRRVTFKAVRARVAARLGVDEALLKEKALKALRDAATEALEHDDECFHCGQAALADMTLLNCDLCTRSYHFACADLAEEPTGVFACPACAPEGLCHVTGEAPAPHRCGHCGRRFADAAIADAGGAFPDGELWRCFVCEDTAGLGRVVAPDPEDAARLLVTWTGLGAWHASSASRARVALHSAAKLRNFDPRRTPRASQRRRRRGLGRRRRREARRARGRGPRGLSPERVVAEKRWSVDGRSPSRLLRVKWAGLDYDDCTWEREADVAAAAPEAVAAFDGLRAGLDTAAVAAFRRARSGAEALRRSRPGSRAATSTATSSRA